MYYVTCKLQQVGILLSFCGVISLAYVNSDGWIGIFLASNLVLSVIINAFRALFRATNRFDSNFEMLIACVKHFVSANLSKFPIRYMGSLCNGVTCGGLLPVLVNLLILSLDVDMQMAGFGCFVFSGDTKS